MSERIERFCKTTRWFHWSFALSYLTLAATGAGLALREAAGLTPGGVERLLDLHKIAAVALLVLPAVVLLSGDTARTWSDLREVFRWSRDDLRWLALQPLAAVGRAELPPAGKLNAGQKVNALLTMGLAVGLATTGVLLWRRPGALAPWFVHLALFVSWIPLFGGHLFLALVNPSTRPALRGITVGRVERSWAEHHHGAWGREADRAARLRAIAGGEPAAASHHHAGAPVELPAVESAADGQG